MSARKMSAEKIDDVFDANLNFWLDCKTCTMCNNDSNISCVFLGPTFRASREAFRRLRGNHIFLKFVLGPTWALMTSQRKSMRAWGHFYGDYATFFPALPFWWNSHHWHLGPDWGLALICGPPRYPPWGSRFVAKVRFGPLWLPLTRAGRGLGLELRSRGTPEVPGPPGHTRPYTFP